MLDTPVLEAPVLEIMAFEEDRRLSVPARAEEDGGTEDCRELCGTDVRATEDCERVLEAPVGTWLDVCETDDACTPIDV